MVSSTWIIKMRTEGIQRAEEPNGQRLFYRPRWVGILVTTDMGELKLVSMVLRSGWLPYLSIGGCYKNCRCHFAVIDCSETAKPRVDILRWGLGFWV